MTYVIRSKRFWIRVVTITVALFCVGAVTLFGISWYALNEFTKCRNVVLSSIPSPDDTKTIYVFRQECNATVPDSVWASIATTNRPSSPDRASAFVGVSQGTEILPVWHGNDAVEVAFIPSGGNFQKREAKVGDIKIGYK
jgi:hypothetical protein